MASTPDTYRMNNETRARAILKDLSRICKEAGLKVRNSALQGTVSRILGYEDWAEMLASIGGHETLGPEDSELDHADLIARRARQADALARIGISSITAESVIARLRPTGRTGDAVEASRRLGTLPNSHDYHPYRFMSAWDEMYDLDGFDSTTSGTEDLLAEWSEGRSMHPADIAVCMRNSSENEGNLDLYFRIANDTHIVIDVSRSAEHLAARPIVGDDYRQMHEVVRNGVYVHLGQNAFPSPYLHVGIEGAYIETYGDDEEGDEAPDGITVKLVCSQPFRDLLADEDAQAEDEMQNLRDLLRGPCVILSPNEEETLVHSVRVFAAESTPEAQIWADYVTRPIAAALHAVNSFAAKDIPSTDYVSDEVDPVVARRIERAATDAKLLKAAQDLDLYQFVVRELSEQFIPERARSAPYDARHLEVNADHINGLFNDIAQYYGLNAILPARWAMAAAERYSLQGDTPLHRYIGVSGRFFVIRTCLDAMSCDVGSGSHEDPEMIAYRDEAMEQVRILLADDDVYPLAHMPLLWLTAYACGFKEEATLAWNREAKYDRNELPIIKEALDVAIENNDDGDFPAIINWMMQDVYEETASAIALPLWDPWFVGADCKERTDALEGFLSGKVVPLIPS
ncbi:hypothetical protein G6L37_34700 [Agrobacterium rubi]|nr:hypothetical protein [Agrobacterium rubi]NTF23718.1 hypothetical protein [Agrobacterium rubi]